MLSAADSGAAAQTNAKLSLVIQTGARFPTEDSLKTHVVSGFGIAFSLKQIMICLSIWTLQYTKF